jgi:hypothetical protein
MKRLLLLILLIAIYSTLYSQDYTFKLYTTPLLVLGNLSHPMVSLGGEYIFLSRLGIAAEFGIKIKDNSTCDTLWERSKGYTYRLELKYYDIYKSKKENLRNYISLEYRYIKDNHNEVFTYHQDTSSNDDFKDNYGVLKDIYIGNIKYGVIIGISKRFFSDIYCGIGIRYRDVRNTNREYNKDLGHEHAYVDDIFSDWGLKETSGLYPNLSLGFKIGIRF